MSQRVFVLCNQTIAYRDDVPVVFIALCCSNLYGLIFTSKRVSLSERHRLNKNISVKLCSNLGLCLGLNIIVKWSFNLVDPIIVN